MFTFEWFRRNAALRAELSVTRMDNRDLTQALFDADTDIGNLAEMYAQLKHERDTLREENDALKEQLRAKAPAKPKAKSKEA